MFRATVLPAALVLAIGCSGDKTDQPDPQSKSAPAPAAATPGSAPSDSPPVPPPSAVAAEPGPAYLGVDGVGLVKLDAGKTELVLPKVRSIRDLARADDGTVWVAAIGGVYRIDAAGKSSKLGDHSRPGSVDRIAVAPDGTVYATSFKGVWRYDGKSWSLDDKSQLAGAKLLQDVAVDADGAPWVVSSELVYRKSGGAWQPVPSADLMDKPFFQRIVRAADGAILALGSGGLIRHDGSGWKKIDMKASFGAVDELAVSPAGHIAAAGRGQVRLRYGADLYEISPGSAGYKAKSADAVAVDAAGRTWLATDNGVVVLGPKGELLQQWLPGQVAEVNGSVTAFAIAGAGPELPTLGAQATGTLRGRILKGGAAVAGAVVEMCKTPTTMFKSSPCDSAVFRREVKTDSKGDFQVEKLPIGSYGFAIKPPGKQWLVLIGGQCCSQMQPGKVYDVGSIPLDG